jgi:hypothetical protein
MKQGQASLMPNHNMIHDLLQDLDNAGLRTAGTEQRMHYVAAEQPTFCSEPWDLQKRYHHCSEPSEILPVVSCPYPRREHFPVGNVNTILTGRFGTRIEVVPCWQEIILTGRFVVRVLELRAYF